MIIVERGYYYYLQHTIMKDGKIQTREKYLGKEIPENLEEIKKEFMEKIREEVKDDPSSKGLFKRTKL